jgi:hypothetical protein
LLHHAVENGRLDIVKGERAKKGEDDYAEKEIN